MCAQKLDLNTLQRRQPETNYSIVYDLHNDNVQKLKQE